MGNTHIGWDTGGWYSDILAIFLAWRSFIEGRMHAGSEHMGGYGLTRVLLEIS